MGYQQHAFLLIGFLCGHGLKGIVPICGVCLCGYRDGAADAQELLRAKTIREFRSSPVWTLQSSVDRVVVPDRNPLLWDFSYHIV
jgi:hypothetical protein